MEPEFVHRKNIERFEQLLAGGTLSAAQVRVVSDLLAAEIEGLDRLEKFQTSRDGPSRSLSD